jgi:hypothetical protein
VRFDDDDGFRWLALQAAFVLDDEPENVRAGRQPGVYHDDRHLECDRFVNDKFHRCLLNQRPDVLHDSSPHIGRLLAAQSEARSEADVDFRWADDRVRQFIINYGHHGLRWRRAVAGIVDYLQVEEIGTGFHRAGRIDCDGKLRIGRIGLDGSIDLQVRGFDVWHKFSC